MLKGFFSYKVSIPEEEGEKNWDYRGLKKGPLLTSLVRGREDTEGKPQRKGH